VSIGPVVGMKHARPRSADLGGLHLATEGNGFGQGWLGYSGEMQTRFAELLMDMYNETLNAVNERDAEFAPTDLPTETRTRLIHSLDDWGFEPHKLPDEEVLACTMMLFEALFCIEDLQETLAISLKDQIYPLIHHLRRIYRWENTYHNFEHALDVLQCSYIFLRSAGMVPPVSILLKENSDRSWSSQRQFDSGSLITCLGLKELFVVYIVAIGHDVAHPGFTNLFMKNAETPLSTVYNGKSALEQMHCSLLLRVMRHYGLGSLLDDHSGSQGVKKLLSETVLATDMSVHAAFMKDFRGLVDDRKVGKPDELWRRQVLLCQGLMKCADISNPFRPYHISKHWAAALMGEWTSQAMLEKFMDLPCTVQCSDDPLTEANGQVFFIDTFAKPLLELMVEAIPELQEHLNRCKDNLQRWESRQGELKSTAKVTVTMDSTQSPSSLSLSSTTSSSSSSSSRKRDDYLTAFPLALPKHHPYRNLSQVDRLQIDEDNKAIETRSDGGPERNVDDELGSLEAPPPRSSTSTATSVTLVWPTSVKSPKKQAVLSPPPSNLSSVHSHSEINSDYTTKSMTYPSSASATTSSPSSPCESLPSSVSGDSEYMSVADWSSTGGESHGAASSYRDAESRIGHWMDVASNGSVSSQSRSKDGRGHSRSSTSNNDSVSNRNGFYSHNSSQTPVPDPHAGLRAAADSARPMLRKQKSMLNRKSWGAPGEYSYVLATEGKSMTADNGYLGVGSSPRILSASLPPPPLSSPATLDRGAGSQSLGLSSLVLDADHGTSSDPLESASTTTTLKSIKNLHGSTIIVSQPHPHTREAQASLA
jgi:hypothetical protein